MTRFLAAGATKPAGAGCPVRRHAPVRPAAVALALAALLPCLIAGAPAPNDGAFEQAKRSLEAAIEARDEGRLREAIRTVGSEDSERSAKLLFAAAQVALEIDVYKDLVGALGAMRSEGAIAHMVKVASEHRDWTVRYLAVEALAAVGSPASWEAIFRAFDDRHESVAAAAIRACRARHSKLSVRPLIDALERIEKRDRQSRLRVEVRKALEEITGESFGPPGDWRRWWDLNEKSFDPLKRAERKRDEEVATVIRRVQDRGDYEFLDRLVDGDIVVIAGMFDKVEMVLDALKLPYTLHERSRFGKACPKLDPNSVLVFNCHDNEQDILSADDCRRIGEFVAAGGYLFTSDWGLRNVIERTLPGYISVARETGQHEFRIVPARGQEKHPYLADVFPDNPYERARFKWKIDDMSYTVRAGPKAQVLVESPELGAHYGSPVVACTFRHGRGAVLHVLGHFEKQLDEKGDGFALQQLLVNFVVEKQKFRKKKP